MCRVEKNLESIDDSTQLSYCAIDGVLAMNEPEANRAQSIFVEASEQSHGRFCTDILA